ncbi:ribbon-helix-helix domain-containing protein [Nodosilinea sp. FACHB-13]|uniref:CopG family ribbon-helix-helix protein n=1 Tax=Cyanophyceae TaxID=3028117 RepID=UPI0016841634|nr:ribbon-helix-helix domain-containing protein [Nodosilinea sp. FACHB-13]MBD2106720.1 CopG family transcriptional regulator [Nodosilinea sp. FACHB-13]
MPNQNIGLRLDVELLAQVDALAEQTGQTRTAIITEAIHQRLGLPVGDSVEQRLANVEQRLSTVEQALGSAAEQRRTVAKHDPIQQNPAPPPPTTTAPKQPRQNAQQGASVQSQVSEHPEKSKGLTTGAALVLAKADLTEAQAMGANYDALMVRRYGVKAAPWLESLGWVRSGRKWWPPK